MKKKLSQSSVSARACISALCVAVISLTSSCSEQRASRIEPELLSEESLAQYREQEQGGFNHAYVAYLREVEEDDGETEDLLKESDMTKAAN